MGRLRLVDQRGKQKILHLISVYLFEIYSDVGFLASITCYPFTC